MVTRTKKIFVGGLSAPTTLEDVKSYFEQFGTVSASQYASLVTALGQHIFF
jgi:RNA recognition motif-containing protein